MTFPVETGSTDPSVGLSWFHWLHWGYIKSKFGSVSL